MLHWSEPCENEMRVVVLERKNIVAMKTGALHLLWSDARFISEYRDTILPYSVRLWLKLWMEDWRFELWKFANSSYAKLKMAGRQAPCTSSVSSFFHFIYAARAFRFTSGPFLFHFLPTSIPLPVILLSISDPLPVHFWSASGPLGYHKWSYVRTWGVP